MEYAGKPLIYRALFPMNYNEIRPYRVIIIAYFSRNTPLDVSHSASYIDPVYPNKKTQ